MTLETKESLIIREVLFPEDVSFYDDDTYLIIVRGNSYASNISHIKQLAKVLQEEFPEANEDDIEVVRYSVFKKYGVETLIKLDDNETSRLKNYNRIMRFHPHH